MGDGSSPITCKDLKSLHPNSMHRETPVVCGKQSGYERQGISQGCVIPLHVTAQETLKIGELQAVITNPKHN